MINVMKNVTQPELMMANVTKNAELQNAILTETIALNNLNVQNHVL